MSVKRGLNCSNIRNSPKYLYWGEDRQTDRQCDKHSAGTHRTSSLSSNSDRQMVHFSVLSSKSSVLLFTCDTQQQWTSCWLHINNNTCQCTCCTFQSDMHFGLIVTQSTALSWQWYVTRQKSWASSLSKYVGTNHGQCTHWHWKGRPWEVAITNIRTILSVRMNGDSPSSFWSCKLKQCTSGQTACTTALQYHL